MIRFACALFGALLLLTSTAYGDGLAESKDLLPLGSYSPNKMDCAGGIQTDDGSFENGYGTTSVFFGHIVMKVDPGSYPAKVDTVCTCWQRAGTDSSIDYSLVFWDSDGPGGSPGTRLAVSETFLATGVPSGLSGQFYQADVSGLGLIVNRPFYVGPKWDSGDNDNFFVCADENGPGGQPAYFGHGLFAGITPPDNVLPSVSTPNYRALGIRAVTSEPTSADCIEDLENGMVCLRDGRFEISGTWTDFSNPPVTQPLIWTPQEDINATAGFQNNPTGIQIVMRAADACSVTGTYWLWLGGFTDAGWDITVRDTVTGNQRTWTRDRSSGNFPTTTRDTSTFTCN